MTCFKDFIILRVASSLGQTVNMRGTRVEHWNSRAQLKIDGVIISVTKFKLVCLPTGCVCSVCVCKESKTGKEKEKQIIFQTIFSISVDQQSNKHLSGGCISQLTWRTVGYFLRPNAFLTENWPSKFTQKVLLCHNNKKTLKTVRDNQLNQSEEGTTFSFYNCVTQALDRHYS